MYYVIICDGFIFDIFDKVVFEFKVFFKCKGNFCIFVVCFYLFFFMSNGNYVYVFCVFFWFLFLFDVWRKWGYDFFYFSIFDKVC